MGAAVPPCPWGRVSFGHPGPSGAQGSKQFWLFCSFVVFHPDRSPAGRWRQQAVVLIEAKRPVSDCISKSGG